MFTREPIPSNVAVKRVADELLRDGLLDERELLRAHDVRSAKVGDEAISPGPKLAAERRAGGRQGAGAEDASALCRAHGEAGSGVAVRALAQSRAP